MRRHRQQNVGRLDVGTLYGIDESQVFVSQREQLVVAIEVPARAVAGCVVVVDPDFRFPLHLGKNFANKGNIIYLIYSTTFLT